MAEFKNESLGVRLVVPDRPSDEQLVHYFEATKPRAGAFVFVNLWQGAVTLISAWECARVPLIADLDLDLESEPLITRIVMWSALQVQAHVDYVKTIAATQIAVKAGRDG